jgi:hypothetical protein
MAGGSVYAADIRPEYKGRVWPYYKIHLDDRLREGDAVYLSGAYGGLHSWGYVAAKIPYKDEEQGDVLRVDVSYMEIGNELVPDRAVNQVPELAQLFANRRTSLEKLNARQINSLNRLLHMQGVTAPPDVSEEEDIYSSIGRLKYQEEELVFVFNQPVKLEETRYIEFKEITASNPTDSIKNTADTYAVAYLNGYGGRIFWGIRDDRMVVGVRLNYKQRDDVRREVSVKLTQIKPPAPLGNLHLDIHPILNDVGKEIDDLHIVELRISRGNPDELYATGGEEVWVKTDGGKRKLDHMQKIAEIKRRLGML